MSEITKYVTRVKIAKLFEKPNGYCIWDNPLTTPEIIKKLKIPIKDKNEMEVRYIYERVQIAVLQYQKQQWKNIGRLLLCIQIVEGALVQYLYSKKPNLITNYLLRHKKMVERGYFDYIAKEHSSLATENLSDNEKKLVELETMSEPTNIKRKG